MNPAGSERLQLNAKGIGFTLLTTAEVSGTTNTPETVLGRAHHLIQRSGVWRLEPVIP